MLAAVGRVFRGIAVFLGVLVFLVPVYAALHLRSVFSAARAEGVAPRELCFLNGTTYSHLLLPDGRLSITLSDSARHAEDAARIERLFPDPAKRRAVLDWGRRLAAACTDKHRLRLALDPADPKDRKSDRRRLPEDVRAELERLLAVPVTDAVAAHAAWRRLTAAPGADPEELFRLKEVVAAAAGDPERLARLLDWAADRRTRLEQTTAWPEADGLSLTVRPAPPDTEWVRLWIVWDQFAVTEPMFAARKADLLQIFGGPTNFGRDKWQAVLDYGREAWEQRRAGAVPLPDDGERSLLIAGLDRLCGLDPDLSPRLRAASEPLTQRDKRFGPLKPLTDEDPISVYGGRPKAVQAKFFPFNDDLGGFLLADEGRRPGRFYRIEETDALLPDRSVPLTLLCPGREVPNDSVVAALVFGALMLLPLGWLAFVGMRTLSVGLLGKLLQLEADPADKRYPEFRDEMYGSVWRQLAAAGGVVIASWLVSLQTMDPLTVFWTRSPGVMLFATGYLILIAGVAADAVRDVVTLAFIKAGFDPQRTFWDDLAAALFTVAVMLYFSNGPVAIAAALLVPVVSPWMFRKLGRLVGLGGPADGPPPAVRK